MNKRMNEFAYRDNKVTIFCNQYMVKYLKYFICDSKRFTMVVIQSIKHFCACYKDQII